MKKILSLILLSAMVLSSVGFVYADNQEIKTGTENATVTSYVDFGESYTISIPSEAQIKSSGLFFSVIINSMLIENGHKLNVYLCSDNFDTQTNKWIAYCGKAKVKYDICDNETKQSFKSGDKILSLGSGMVTYAIDLASSYNSSLVLTAGHYTDTLTFRIAIEDAE